MARGGLQSTLQGHCADCAEAIDSVKLAIEAVEEHGTWPESYVKWAVMGDQELLDYPVTDVLFNSYCSRDPTSPLRHLSRSSSIRELKELLSLETVRHHLYVDLALQELKSAAAQARSAQRTAAGAGPESAPEVAELAPREGIGPLDLSANSKQTAAGAGPESAPASAKPAREDFDLLELSTTVRVNEANIKRLTEAFIKPALKAKVRMREPPTPEAREAKEAKEAAGPQSPGHDPSMRAKVEAAVLNKHHSWSIVNRRVVMRSAPSPSAPRLSLVHRGCIVQGNPQIVDGTAWLQLRADCFSGIIENDVFTSGSAAWICIDGACGHLLEPVARPGSADALAARPAPKPPGPEEESEWLVVHPIVFLSIEPSIRAATVAQVMIGCIIRGVPVPVNGTQWLRVRTVWTEHVNVDDLNDGCAWTLINGAVIGLGDLLVKIPVPLPREARVALGSAAETPLRLHEPAS